MNNAYTSFNVENAKREWSKPLLNQSGLKLNLLRINWSSLPKKPSRWNLPYLVHCFLAKFKWTILSWSRQKVCTQLNTWQKRTQHFHLISKLKVNYWKLSHNLKTMFKVIEEYWRVYLTLLECQLHKKMNNLNKVKQSLLLILDIMIQKRFLDSKGQWVQEVGKVLWENW